VIPYIGPEMAKILAAKYEPSDIASPSCADDRVLDREANAGLPRHLVSSKLRPSKILIIRIGSTVRRLIERF
jgi:hypothetical protein